MKITYSKKATVATNPIGTSGSLLNFLRVFSIKVSGLCNDGISSSIFTNV